jgi:hypothetical protein
MSGKGATTDIGGWLRDHGFGQYEATFRQNEIGVEVLRELTEPLLGPLGPLNGCSRRSQLDAKKLDDGLLALFR